jgi:DNA polymerase-3 subunit delta
LSASYQSILNDLKKGNYAPIYLFEGEEPFFIDQLTDYIEEHVLDDAGKAFDQVVMYGRESDGMQVVDEAKRFPMLGERRVIIVKEAQDLKQMEALLTYVKQPVPKNILVLAHKYKKLDGKTTLAKQLRQHSVNFESKKLYDNQISGWIEEHLKTYAYHITPKASALLAEFVGADLSRLSNELQKLTLVVPPSSNITPEDIERNIGISKDYNSFELLNALAYKDILKANKIIKYFSENPKDHPGVVVSAVLYGYFSKVIIGHYTADKSPKGLALALKINPYFAKDYLVGMQNYPMNKLVKIISYLREFDTRGKGVNNVSASEYDLMRELIFKILH